MDTANLTDDELLALSERVEDERRRRGLASPRAVRLGDLAETLVVERLDLRRAPTSTAGYDAMDEDGTRYQIKARRLGTRGDRQLGVIRNIDRHGFDYLIVVLFSSESDTPEGMWQLPFDVVREKAKHNEHQYGHVLFATDALLADERVARLWETPKPGSMPHLPPASPPKVGSSRREGVADLRATATFRDWLAAYRGHSANVVNNHVSRCRRVERELALSLDASVRTEAGLADVIDRIRHEILADAPDKTRIEGQASLIAATRRYAEFIAWQAEADPVEARREA